LRRALKIGDCGVALLDPNLSKLPRNPEAMKTRYDSRSIGRERLKYQCISNYIYNYFLRIMLITSFL
jgi:hypothetical protein